MIIDCIGCLHGSRPKLEGGDMLIITGDLTKRDALSEHYDFLDWLKGQEYRKKILIAGNHDNFLVDNPTFYDKTGIDYLCDSGTEFEGIKIWGSPWSTYFKGINPKCTAFTCSEEACYDKYQNIPKGTNILITHQPPYSLLDGIMIEDGSLFHVGSAALYAWLKYVERPRLHVFSHIHEGHGQTEYFATYRDKRMTSINCSIMNINYKPVNKPIRIVLGDEDFPART